MERESSKTRKAREARPKGKAKGQAQAPQPKASPSKGNAPRPKAKATAPQPRGAGPAAARDDAAQAHCVRVTRPRVDIERSRQQILCRTGFKGVGQSHAIRYGPGHDHRTEIAAVKVSR